MMTTLQIGEEVARKIALSLDDAQECLESEAATMPSGGSYGGGEVYIASMLSTFADLAGTLAQAVGYGAISVRAAAADSADADDEAVAAFIQVAKEMGQ